MLLNGLLTKTQIQNRLTDAQHQPLLYYSDSSTPPEGDALVNPSAPQLTCLSFKLPHDWVCTVQARQLKPYYRPQNITNDF